jgi:subtilisin family serine protease
LTKDDRVEYALPQRHLSRHKRTHRRQFDEEYGQNNLSDEELDEWLLRLKDVDEEPVEIDPRIDDIEKMIYELSQQLDKQKEVGKRKNMQQYLDEIEKEIVLNLDKMQTLPKDIDFNDAKYKQQWYLIDEGQFDIPLTHDLNVKEAWLKGFTGKNVSIVIIDDGLDHEHPDFAGKYVLHYFLIYFYFDAKNPLLMLI